jgi:metabolite-proton symporter
MATEASTDAASERTLKKTVWASLIGTTIEWYDFYIYGTAAALVFNKLFFPAEDPLTGTMIAFGTYALGFIARPIGGAVFGHFGDRIGRKTLLLTSLILMGAATFLIGLLPTYAEIGVWAPIMLVTLRMLQGFGVGGEWGGAVLLIAEHAPAKSRGFWTSWAQVGVPAGNLLAAGIVALLTAVQSPEDFLAWGWRVPFLASGVLIVFGLWLRVTLSESPMFKEAQKRHAAEKGSPVLQALAQRPGGLFVGAGLRLGENISFYVITTFSLTYIVELQGGTRGMALTGLLIGAIAECVTLPLFAALSDRIGRRFVYAIGAFGMAVWAFGLFLMLNQGNALAVTMAMVIGLVLHGAMYGPQAAFMAELFPTRMRYSGASIAYQATSIVAGSLAPIIALALWQHYHSFVPIALYVALACVVSGIAALIARETRGVALDAIESAPRSRTAT